MRFPVLVVDVAAVGQTDAKQVTLYDLTLFILAVTKTFRTSRLTKPMLNSNKHDMLLSHVPTRWLFPYCGSKAAGHQTSHDQS